MNQEQKSEYLRVARFEICFHAVRTGLTSRCQITRCAFGTFIKDGAIVSCLDLVAGKSPKLANELHELVTDSILLGDCL